MSRRRDEFCEWLDMELYSGLLVGITYVLLPTVEMTKMETLLALFVMYISYMELVSWVQDIVKKAKRSRRRRSGKQASECRNEEAA